MLMRRKERGQTLLKTRPPSNSAESDQHKTLINLQYAFKKPLGERRTGQIRADLVR